MRPDRVAAAVLLALRGPRAPRRTRPGGRPDRRGDPSPATGAVEIDGATPALGDQQRVQQPGVRAADLQLLLRRPGARPRPGRDARSRGALEQQAGDVAIEKWNGSAWQPATWAGLTTDSSGAALGSPTAGTFSNHRFVFADGTGTVDAAAGTAHVAWDGDVTVLYYSGMSFFTSPTRSSTWPTGAARSPPRCRGYASSIDEHRLVGAGGRRAR